MKERDKESNKEELIILTVFHPLEEGKLPPLLLTLSNIAGLGSSTWNLSLKLA